MTPISVLFAIVKFQKRMLHVFNFTSGEEKILNKVPII